MAGGIQFTVLHNHIVIRSAYIHNQVLDRHLGIQFPDRQHFLIFFLRHKHAQPIEQTPVQSHPGGQSVRTGIVQLPVFSVCRGLRIVDRLFLSGSNS